jgi:hypothetical protein
MNELGFPVGTKPIHSNIHQNSMYVLRNELPDLMNVEMGEFHSHWKSSFIHSLGMSVCDDE